MNKTNAVAKPLGFLDLPGEIRNQIYSDSLNIKEYGYTNPSLIDSYLAFRSSCRTIYYESTSFPYSSKTFFFKDANKLFRFLNRIGLARRQQLRSLCFIWKGGNQGPAVALLQECINLAHARIQIPKRNAFTWFRFSTYLKLVRGLESVEVQVGGPMLGIEDELYEEERPWGPRHILELGMVKPRFDYVFGRRGRRVEGNEVEVWLLGVDIEEGLRRLFLEDLELGEED